MKTILILALGVAMTGCASLSSFFSFGKQQQQVAEVKKIELPAMIYVEAKLKALPEATDTKEKAVALARKRLNQQVFQNYRNIDLVKRSEGATAFELALTKAIYAEIPKPSLAQVIEEKPVQNPETGEVTAVVKVTRAEVIKSQMSRLYLLDGKLRQHLHVTGKGSKLTQLIALLPAAPVLMERRLLIADLEAMSGETLALPNENLAKLMENQIERLIDQLVISLDAMTPESAAFESGLKKALAEKGFNMSARKPDLTFKYFIELEGKEVIGDIEMLNDASKTYGTVSGQYQQQAMESLAKASMDELVRSMIGSMKAIIKARHQEGIRKKDFGKT
ncbi:MAG: hypothetical protein CO158_04280 [Piscirickettsiaceae bacterium CG_4_9_14_3_um_filter_43_564]|nr:hypothetical protein [Thiomicrospira sp.]OIP97016.1 MAG: hypothetical protein AUK56_00315 [Thiomicrospira sp. CG2_30_44_34]PIQ02732.1 MAG: hypothetical protein COW74_10070 [Piscirickettsiaceae bacterium CG18_big_fil_WC_8_21_14_2_50_44_103]PIU39103.1 MAG: hypothetical protein COT01_03205 [Piscirickettsiaceae bacterium CG07_land_8_20_14_0_80_44_28]PIW57932.1 MAG: hypothetical protein COW14_03425 [Piscirickettsiaceae bacterium CG12_big_fil_rev_8_21_14_0_65_44_934]PIW77977.1 MAG: hypothetical p